MKSVVLFSTALTFALAPLTVGAAPAQTAQLATHLTADESAAPAADLPRWPDSDDEDRC
jgi:hypothetical protein